MQFFQGPEHCIKPPSPCLLTHSWLRKQTGEAECLPTQAFRCLKNFSPPRPVEETLITCNNSQTVYHNAMGCLEALNRVLWTTWCPGRKTSLSCSMDRDVAQNSEKSSGNEKHALVLTHTGLLTTILNGTQCLWTQKLLKNISGNHTLKTQCVGHCGFQHFGSSPYCTGSINIIHMKCLKQHFNQGGIFLSMTSIREHSQLFLLGYFLLPFWLLLTISWQLSCHKKVTG